MIKFHFASYWKFANATYPYSTGGTLRMVPRSAGDWLTLRSSIVIFRFSKRQKSEATSQLNDINLKQTSVTDNKASYRYVFQHLATS